MCGIEAPGNGFLKVRTSQTKRRNKKDRPAKFLSCMEFRQHNRLPVRLPFEDIPASRQNWSP